MTLRPLFFIPIAISLAALSPAAAQTAAKKSNSKASPKETAHPAQGSGPQLVSQYGDWGVYVANAAKGKICYALAEPKSRAPKLNRDPGYLFISTRPGENVHNEVSAVVGFAMKEGTDATLDIGGMNFPFYTKNDSAWVKNAAEEPKLVEALRKNRDLTMKSTSTRGNVTTDHYSLSGIAQALDRVAQECK